MLDVPEEGPRTILPSAPASSLVQRNLSEIHSAPGRQAAFLIRTTNLRSLAFPLSAVATATSLAETNPSIGATSGGKYEHSLGPRKRECSHFHFLFYNRQIRRK